MDRSLLVAVSAAWREFLRNASRGHSCGYPVSRGWNRIGSPVGVALLLSACWHWTPSTVAPQPDQAVPHLGHIRVGRCANESLELYHAGWSADTLVGIEQAPHTGEGSQRPRAVPQDSVCSLEQRRVNVGATVGVAAGVAALLLFMAALVAGGAGAIGSGP